MKHLLPLTCVIVLCLVPLTFTAQTPSNMKLVALGDVDGPMLRDMAAESCGPFFTFVSMDARGGGFVKMVVDGPHDRALTSLPVKAIHVKFCDSCDTPLFSTSGDASSVRGHLMISREHWKDSPCLKSAKLSKR
jgi:hypothetical protein